MSAEDGKVAVLIELVSDKDECFEHLWRCLCFERVTLAPLCFDFSHVAVDELRK